MRGPENCLKNRPQISQTDVNKNVDDKVLSNTINEFVKNTVNVNVNSDNTEIVHISRKSADECALMVLIGNKNHKALWYSGAVKSVISFD